MNKARVFVSHSTHTELSAAYLEEVRKVEQRHTGVELWVDRHQIKVAEDWLQRIFREIWNSNGAVLLLSERARTSSPVVGIEIAALRFINAVHRELPLAVIVVDEEAFTQPSTDVLGSLGLKQLHVIKRSDPRSACDALVDYLKLTFPENGELSRPEDSLALRWSREFNGVVERASLEEAVRYISERHEYSSNYAALSMTDFATAIFPEQTTIVCDALEHLFSICYQQQWLDEPMLRRTQACIDSAWRTALPLGVQPTEAQALLATAIAATSALKVMAIGYDDPQIAELYILRALNRRLELSADEQLRDVLFLQEPDVEPTENTSKDAFSTRIARTLWKATIKDPRCRPPNVPYERWPDVEKLRLRKSLTAQHGETCLFLLIKYTSHLPTHEAVRALEKEFPHTCIILLSEDSDALGGMEISGIFRSGSFDEIANRWQATNDMSMRIAKAIANRNPPLKAGSATSHTGARA